MNESLDRAAREAGTRVGRRHALGAIAASVLGSTGALLLGSRTVRSHSAVVLQAKQGEKIFTLVDFTFERPGAPKRSRVVLRQRQLGKIRLGNGKRIGIVPNAIEDRREVELSVFELATGDAPPRFLKRVIVPISRELKSLGIPGTLGLSIAVARVENRELSLSEGGSDDQEQCAECCVMCDV
jgi:hypothetical protein